MLHDAVASILNGNTLPAELIVVDQSATPDQHFSTLDDTRGCQIRYLWSQSVGLCHANNLGVEAACHDLLVFTHDDVLVAAEWFDVLFHELRQSGPRAVVTGRILPAPAEIPGGFAPTLRTGQTAAVYEGRIGYDVLKPLNMALHRSALHHVGPFDVRLGPGTPFPGAEDSDLGFRLLEAGYRIVYAPQAIVYHRAWRARRDYLPLRWRYGVAQGAFLAKHLRRSDLHMLKRFVGDIRRRIRRFPRRLWHERERALGDPLFILGNLLGALQWYLWGKRSGSGASLTQNPLEGTPGP